MLGIVAISIEAQAPPESRSTGEVFFRRSFDERHQLLMDIFLLL